MLGLDSAEEAIAIANASPYGLGATIWSRDIDGALQLARRIESGIVFINGMVTSDPRLPFGGVKQSGWGRELGIEGLDAFLRTKFVSERAAL